METSFSAAPPKQCCSLLDDDRSNQRQTRASVGRHRVQSKAVEVSVPFPELLQMSPVLANVAARRALSASAGLLMLRIPAGVL